MGPEPMEVEVYTAVELSEKQMKALEKNLSESMEKIVELKVIENKDLIGGLVLKIGDTIFDGSVANKMLQMQEQLLQA
jgi:F-type H+-transporting ATPase subunit delta